MVVTAAANTNNIVWVLVSCGLLIALLIVAFAGYAYLKRWMNQTEETGGGGFTLSALRELHRQGKMSDAEYEQTRALMVGSAKKMADQMPDVLPRRSSRPTGGKGPSTPSD